MSDITENSTPADLRAYAERKAAEANEAKAEAEKGRQAQKELAFVKAGVSTDTPLAQLALSNYTGELDAASITAYVTELGLGTPAPAAEQETETAPDPTAELVQAHLAREQAATAAASDPNLAEQKPKPAWEAAMEGFNEGLQTGKTRDQAAAKALGGIVEGRLNGDTSQVWTGHNEEDLAAARAFDRN